MTKNLTPLLSWPFPTGADSLSTSKTSSNRWGGPEIKLLAKLYVEGKSPAEIASQLNRSAKAIINQLSDAKILKTPTGVAIAAEITKMQKSKTATKSPVTAVMAALSQKVPQKPVNHRAAWDAAADRSLVIEFTKGLAPEVIAALRGRTTASVAGRLHALGLLIFDKDTLTYSTAPKVWFKVPVA